MARCMQCGKELTHNEIGAHRKFINRGAEQFFCKQCLSKHLGVTPELIDEKYMVNNSSSRKRYASPKAGTELYLDLVFRQ